MFNISGQASRTLQYKSTVKILAPSPAARKGKVDDFYAARSRSIAAIVADYSSAVLTEGPAKVSGNRWWFTRRHLVARSVIRRMD